MPDRSSVEVPALIPRWRWRRADRPVRGIDGPAGSSAVCERQRGRCGRGSIRSASADAMRCLRSGSTRRPTVLADREVARGPNSGARAAIAS